MTQRFISPRESGTLLSLRAAVILLLAVAAGIAAGVLAHLAGQSLPAGVLVGGGASGGAMVLFNAVIGR
ncbi:hypothetical protein ACFO1B_29755 [Dactylosporangium siamense]|uniref:Uncharacterized protein n=1 Tax=Dactylosporangium siamense TaxID=685454 RepID=A0A919Q0W5_9ACTN|nr:hypothetical protein [Dactylosporangium siamense]GIG53237.1 hypothetical protein Dsi01nite_112780 [Dactylosporangium siamense]